MENLPKDVLTLLLLDLDIDSVISMCQTSSKFKNKICLNDYFWMNKLSHDFGLNSDLKWAKQKYMDTLHVLKVNPNLVYQQAVFSNNLKLVKLSLTNGADVNYAKHGDPTPLIYALFRGYYEIFDYLVDKAIYTRYTLFLNMKNFTNFYDKNANNNEEVLKRHFSILIPKNIKYNNSKDLNLALLNKFIEAFTDGHKYGDLKFYNEWIDYYTKLAQ